MEFKGPSFDLSFSPSFAPFSAASKSQERLWHVNKGGWDSYYSAGRVIPDIIVV